MYTPGPFRAEGATVKAITHGSWFKVCRVDGLKYTPEGNADTARQIVAALNQEAAARAMLAALKQIAQLSANYGDAEQPEDEEWDGMQDAYDQGCRAGAWDAAAVALAAIAAAEAADIREG